MKSVGIPEEEFKFTIPVPAPNIIPSSSSSPPYFSYVSNQSAEEAKENVSGEGRKQRRRETFSCQKMREIPQIYLER